METVEKTTSAIDATSTSTAGESPTVGRPRRPAERRADHAGPASVSGPTPVTGVAGWAALVQTGLSLLEQLAEAARTPTAEAGATTRSGLSLVHRDAQTGGRYLRIPMPAPDVLDRALGSIAALLDQFRR